jgi:hypothetical protein
MEKIQLRAAEINQAEQLGKITSQAQLLQITNDLARLRVKQSILALDDAIASGDIKAITAATNKLNADLKILGALTNQEIKLKDIKSILESIAPKDLINLANLNEAIRLLGLINGAASSTPVSTPTPPKMPSSLNPVTGAGGVRGSTAFTAEQLQYFEDREAFMYRDAITNLNNQVMVNNNFNGIVGDPNAVAELIEQVIKNAVQRGTLREVAIP